jgi:hypothetical protein
VRLIAEADDGSGGYRGRGLKHYDVGVRMDSELIHKTGRVSRRNRRSNAQANQAMDAQAVR